ncbi:MAG: response regulator [Deltaproteobacteria bacterium]|nr:response regulator [Deltaproteobacteria bacterium]
MPQRGLLLEGRYRILDPIGEGRSGCVLAARDEQLGRDVAVRFVDSGLFSAEARARFLARARDMVRVEHREVVGVLSVGAHDGAPYLVQEFVPGPDLGTWLAGQGRLSVEEAIEVLTPIARGLGAIHEAGAVHGDLRPEKVRVGPAFRLALADQGLATLLAACDRGDYPLSGWPEFIAPETIVGKDVPAKLAPRADVYALSAVAYLLLCGRPPFAADDARQVLWSHLMTPPPRASELRPDLPAGFDAPLGQALAKDPEDRPASATALLEALRAVPRPGPPAEPRSPRLVVADDDGVCRTLVEAMLRAGFPDASVETHPDGASALRALCERPAHVAITDLHMPGMNGLELVAALRASPQGMATRIIVMSAMGGAAEWRLLSSLGADDFLVKPFADEELVRSTERLLRLPRRATRR